MGCVPYGWFQAYKEAHPQLLRVCGKTGESTEHKRVQRLYGQALKIYAEKQRYSLMDPTAAVAVPETSAVAEDTERGEAAQQVPVDEDPFAKYCYVTPRAGQQYWSKKCPFKRDYELRRRKGCWAPL